MEFGNETLLPHVQSNPTVTNRLIMLSVVELESISNAEALRQMLRIRLRRVGKKKQPSYRIVVADARSPRDGSVIDQVGHYNPLTDPPTVVVDDVKVKHWLGVGAKPSETVGRILAKQSSA